LYYPRGNDDVKSVSVDIAQPFYAVYFGSPDAATLVPELRQGLGTLEERLASLIAGPELPGLVAALPAGVELLGYSQLNDVLYLNFNHYLVTNHPGGSAGELITVYAIVNTVVGAGGVRRVQILVDGRPIQTLAGHLDLTEPLEKDYELLGSSQI
jgi:germination protein M